MDHQTEQIQTFLTELLLSDVEVIPGADTVILTVHVLPYTKLEISECMQSQVHVLLYAGTP